MPRGGNRKEKAEANGKRVGRPPGEVKAMQHIYKDFSKDVQAFQASLRRGFAGGMAAIAAKFPTLVEKLLAKAIDGDDLEAQKFLVERFLKVVQPDVPTGGTPAADFLRALRETFATTVVTISPALPADDGSQPGQDRYVEGVSRPIPS